MRLDVLALALALALGTGCSKAATSSAGAPGEELYPVVAVPPPPPPPTSPSSPPPKSASSPGTIVVAGGVDAGPQDQVVVEDLVEADPTLPHRLELFTATWCTWCKKTKAWLEENHVRFDERDVENAEHNHALHNLFPQQKDVGIPVVHWDDTLIVGYSAERMELLLYPAGRVLKQRRVVHQWLSDTPRDLSPMYTYVDDDGSMQIVKRLEDVPAKYRARAKQHASY